MADVTITIRPSGPYVVEGPVTLRDADGNEIDLSKRDSVKLCRCGASTTKPFCDGTHSSIGFLAANLAAQKTE
jgi:3-phenylpropionate/trans-cinnamate dioxygenase ferredoxin subunit